VAAPQNGHINGFPSSCGEHTKMNLSEQCMHLTAEIFDGAFAP
jgi:hypothetical protein